MLPEPLLTVVSELFFRTGGGSLNAVGTIGAGMLIAGIVAIVRWQRDRAGARGTVGAMSSAAGQTRP